jgi:hypothetical protein
MKLSVIFLLLIFSLSLQAEVDCLRFMGKKAKLLWKKQCQTILDDVGLQAVETIDGCFGKYKLGKREFIVFNSDLQKKQGFVKKDSIITNGALGIHAQESEDEIRLNKKSASPELLKRYLHVINYNKHRDVLSISKYEGRLNLKKKYHLTLSCR